MNCPSGFDPFAERDERLLAHARACPTCGEVLRVHEACKATWRRGLAQDEARAVFRERRIGRSLPPGRKVMTSAVVAVVLAAVSGFALARLGAPPAPEREAAPVASSAAPPSVSSAGPPSAPPSAPLPPPSAAPPSARPDDGPGERPAVRAARPAEDPREDPREAWRRALALLEAGDRAGAERAFRGLMETRGADPGLRSRATFRWAQLLLARGETRAPREALYRLVRGKDAALGLDAALLLERCAPAERQPIWDAYLEVTTDPSLRAAALRRRDGQKN